MDALKNLTNNIPEWQKRLVNLSEQIDLRQKELGALSVQEAQQVKARSLRNKGSTESLKPKDDGNLPQPTGDETTTPPLVPILDTPTTTTESSPPVKVEVEVEMVDSGDANPQEKPSTPATEKNHEEPHQTSPGAALHKQAREAMLSAHARKRAQIRKRQRASSVKSGDITVPTAYRTRSMIIVYYDSYVQGFFDELVCFVSSSRNMMRKAKMAAKVAQIKRMAEEEIPDEETGKGEEALPSLRYMSSQRFSSVRPGIGSSASQQPDIYDKLDKFLEAVQMTCEHGAHQFLRDADCNDELTKITKCMTQVLELATKESERVKREEPEAARSVVDYGKVRARRPISMRRDLITTTKTGNGSDVIEPAVPAPPPTQLFPSSNTTKTTQSTSTPAATPLPPSPIVNGSNKNNTPAGPLASDSGSAPPLRTGADQPIAVDPSIQMGADDRIEVDAQFMADEGIDVNQELPKLIYRSTRGMRSRAIHS